MQLSFANVMPGYRVFQIRDSNGNLQMVDTEELAQELDLLTESGDIKDTMIRVHQLCNDMRGSKHYNELLTDLAEFFVAKKLGKEAIMEIVDKKRRNDADRHLVISASIDAATALTNKLDLYGVSHESIIVFTEKESGKTDELNLKRVVGGVLCSLPSLPLRAIKRFTEQVEQASSLQELIRALSQQATYNLDACINFNPSMLDS